jgi:hypothetical protein
MSSSATDAALARGKAAAGRSRWEPVGVEFRGRLTAVVRNTDRDEVEEVYHQSGQWIFRGVGRDRTGDVSVSVVRDAGLKRIAKAMLLREDDDLYREAFERMRERTREATGNGNGRKARRKR